MTGRRLLPILQKLFLAIATFITGVCVNSSAPLAEMGHAHLGTYVLFEELEYAADSGAKPVTWDVTSWVGGDWNRIWLKSEGGASTKSGDGDGELQLLYSRLVSPFWEFQVGVRGDLIDVDDESVGRALLVLGLQGLAPYWFEVDSALFVSDEGDVSTRIRGTLDLFVTQRAILQTSAEMNAAVQSVPEFGVGSGFNDIQLGLRRRYELGRELAPYVGVSWKTAFAETADLAHDVGDGANDWSGVAGLRLWF